MPAPSDTLAVILSAWAAGTACVATAVRSMREVRQGHFKVVWLACAGLAAAAGPLHRPGFVVAAACLVAFAAVYRGLDLVAGSAAAAFGVASLTTVAPSVALASALLLGSVTNAMLLGHWHLNQPRLGTRPLMRVVIVLWTAIGLYATTTVLQRPLDVARLTALAFTAFAAVLTAMVTALVRTRSIMSATGILYLEVLLCFVAVFAGTLAG